MAQQLPPKAKPTIAKHCPTERHPEFSNDEGISLNKRHGGHEPSASQLQILNTRSPATRIPRTAMVLEIAFLSNLTFPLGLAYGQKHKRKSPPTSHPHFCRLKRSQQRVGPTPEDQIIVTQLRHHQFKDLTSDQIPKNSLTGTSVCRHLPERRNIPAMRVSFGQRIYK